MKFWIPMTFALLGLSLLTSARPKDSATLSVSTDKVTTTERNTLQILDIRIDRITDPDKYGTVEEIWGFDGDKIANGNADSDHADSLPAIVNKKCPSVVCSKPPSDAVCETASDPDINIMGPIMGVLSDCCPLYVCNRADGSFFTHFGMSSVNPKGLTQSGVATSGSTATSSASRLGFSGLSSFSSRSEKANSPTSNSFVSSSNFDVSGSVANGNSNIIPFPPGLIQNAVVPGGPEGSIFAPHGVIRYANLDGKQNPNLPMYPMITLPLPRFPLHFPVDWNLRGRRLASSFGAEPIRAPGSQNSFRPGQHHY